MASALAFRTLFGLIPTLFLGTMLVRALGGFDRFRETVSEFVTRRLGREVLEGAMEPYVSGPLASDPDRAEVG